METKTKKPLALIASSNAAESSNLRSILDRVGVASEIVATAHGFLQKLHLQKPDFCLIDVDIENEGCGLLIVESVRKTLGPSLGLIMISSTSNRDTILEALGLGADDFILKPVDKDILTSKIAYFAVTEKTQTERPSFFSVPPVDSAAVLEVGLDIQSVDETGLKLLGPHYLGRGLALQLDGAFIEMLTGKAKILVKVSSTWSENTGLHGVYAEFDDTDASLMASVRKYLASK